MRYRGDFPARTFLERYPDDLKQFLWRAEEMATFGSIALWSQGHQLEDEYKDLHQFKMPLTRSWGFKDGSVYVVAFASTKKKPKEQENDYKRALSMRADYLNGISDD